MAKVNKQSLFLTRKNILGLIIKLAIPLLLSNFLKSLNNLVDVIFLAHSNIGSQEKSITATGIHFPIYNTFVAIGAGLAIALVAIITQYLGMNKKREARSYAGKFCFLFIYISLILTALSLLLTSSIIKFLGAHILYEEAYTYFIIRAFDYIPFFFFLYYQALRHAEGEMLRPVLINSLGLIVNITITYLLVNVLKQGIKGAALGTLMGEIATVPLAILGLFGSKKYLRLGKDSQLIPYKDDLKQILRFALPAMIAMVATALCFVIIQRLLVGFGTNVSSMFTGANRISQFLSNTIMAFTTSLAPFIGTNIGAKQIGRAWDGYRKTLLFIIFISGVIALLMVLFGNYLLRMTLGVTYVGENKIIAQYFLIWFLLSQLQMCFIWADTALFNASGNNKIAFISAMVRFWIIRIPLLLCLRYFSNMSYHSVWFAMIVSNTGAVLFNLILKNHLDLNPKVQVKK